MKARTKDEWLEWYKGRMKENGFEFRPGEQILFHPEHGFVSFTRNDDAIEVGNMCGDGKYWFTVLKTIMREEKLTKICAYTVRNPRAWERKYGKVGRPKDTAHVKGYYMEVEIDELKV